MKKYVIIVAGGNGTRMKSSVPKQFLFVHDKPIIARTINQFLLANCEVIVVLPKEHFSTFKTEMLHYCTSQQLLLAEGGETRFHSVKNGLDLVGDEGYVAVHDAVRPFIEVDLIEKSFKLAQENGCAIASVPLKDSIRKVSKLGNVARNRSDYQLIQTPQTFNSKKLKEAYNQQFSDVFTDDASVYELNGNTIHLFTGDYKNIKITTPEDLLIAKTFAK